MAKEQAKYKDLDVGEQIQAGDQFYDVLLGWVTIEEDEYEYNRMIGQKVEDTPSQKMIRRLVTT